MATHTRQTGLSSHKKIERNVTLLGALALLAVAIGGIVEIAPLFWIDNTVEKVGGHAPYTPLELAGRNIYMREGCYNCHSQMIRPFRDEVERYGHYSLAAESMYDHPFQWGSKRTGPDLARVGEPLFGRMAYAASDRPAQRWCRNRSCRPMRFLAERDLQTGHMANDLTALRPRRRALYRRRTSQQGERTTSRPQADPDADAADLQKRYPKAQVRDFDGNPGRA